MGEFEAEVASTTKGHSTDSKGPEVAEGASSPAQPDHLVVLVHGILATVNDWKYVDKQLSKRLGRGFMVYASASNEALKTVQGIDRSGERLATEVSGLVAGRRHLRRISFVGHSLGGLIARYAVALLYSPRDRAIAGLQAGAFVTLATPHLGVRGKGQLPFLLGVSVLERIAVPVAPILVGRTGKQLFLTDGLKSGRGPLLLRMAPASSPVQDDLPFIQSLAAFQVRVAYANAGYDHMVGWQTSSIRRPRELPKIPQKSISQVHKHVMRVEDCEAVDPLSDAPVRSFLEATDKDSFIQMQEEMIRGLQSLPWRKIDVSFHEGFFPFFAHNNIHVKMQWLHFDGQGVVRHVADTLRGQQEQEETQVLSRL